MILCGRCEYSGFRVDLLPCPGAPEKCFLLNLKSLLSKAIRLRTAACPALLETLYVLRDWDVEMATVFAVAHSPLAGASSQDFDWGAIRISWVSVREISSIASEQGPSVAVEKKENDRTSHVVRIECMAFSRT